MPLETGAGWQPIGSLPRDGGLVVIVNAKWGEDSLVIVHRDKHDGVLTGPSGREWYRSTSYTHWMELPPMPCGQPLPGGKK